MSKFQKQKRASMFVVLSLVITCALLIQVRSARAEEMDAILPSQGLDFVSLFAGQDIDVETSQVISTGFHTVGVTSFGNKSLTAKLTVTTDNVTGFWWVLIIGTSSKNGIGFGIGFTNPSGGLTAEVNLDLWLGFGLVIGGVNADASYPVSAAEPIKYKINVKGAAI